MTGMATSYNNLKKIYPELTRSIYSQLIKQLEKAKHSSDEINSYKNVLKNLALKSYLPENLNQLAQEAAHLEVVAETSGYLVVNKPAGLLSSGLKVEVSLQSILQYRQIDSGDNPLAHVRPVHLLDKATSGVIVFSKDLSLHEHFSKQFRQRQVEKIYYAVVQGDFKSYLDDLSTTKLIIESNISKKPVGRKYISVKPGEGYLSEPAKTEVEFVKLWVEQSDCSIVKIKPYTGRTHQIRVHLSEQGFPIVGDKLYGGSDYKRLLLHAQALKFSSGEEFRSSLPVEFA